MRKGNTVIIPAQDVVMGDWHGTGYIVMDMETGAGAYMISGGLNGGVTKFLVTLSMMCGIILSAALIAELAALVVSMLAALVTATFLVTVASLVAAVLAGIVMTMAFLITIDMIMEWDYYWQTENEESALEVLSTSKTLGVATIIAVCLAAYLSRGAGGSTGNTGTGEDPGSGGEPGGSGEDPGAGGGSGGSGDDPGTGGGSGGGGEDPGTGGGSVISGTIGGDGNYSHIQNLEGLNKIREHLAKNVDGLDYKPNEIMLNKIENMLANNQELTGAYKDFYEHELTEMALMEQGYGYDDAHNMALQIHNVQPQALYSPEVVKEYYKWFNKKDYEYWGIIIEK